MTTTPVSSKTSSISLILNDSWIAHIGSRIYRIAIETIEKIGNAFSYSLIQPYSGKRLYQLIDSYRDINKAAYSQSRFNYADSILLALKDEKNVIEKTKKVGAILHTHILGLSILRSQDKEALAQHLAYIIIPSLIDEFGQKAANRSILALHELDDITDSKSIDEYAIIYKNLTLQDIELFVETLHQLKSDLPKELLIHELLLSRNRNLSQEAKDKITTVLKDTHYIDIKLQKKYQLLDQLKGQGIDLSEKYTPDQIALESETHQRAQLEALHYTGRSMFFDQTDIAEETLSENPIEYPDISTPTETTASETISQSSDIALPSEIPVGIRNQGSNCWYNSALQILCNTPIYMDVLRQSDEFSKEFPTLHESFQSYREICLGNSDLRILSDPSPYGMRSDLPKEIFEASPEMITAVEQYKKNGPSIIILGDKLQKIRTEIHLNLDKEFSESMQQEDSKQFLTLFLQKLSIDVFRPSSDLGSDIFSHGTKHLLIDKVPSDKIDLKTLFIMTDYQPYGIIFHSGSNDKNGHYFAAVKLKNSWYLCNDSQIGKVPEQDIEKYLQKYSSFIIASRNYDDLVDKPSETESLSNNVSETQGFLQQSATWITSLFNQVIWSK